MSLNYYMIIHPECELFPSKQLDFTNTGFSLLIALILAVLYGFLYTLLMLQDFSLILGSVGLFVIIGIIMYVTRDVDWYPQED